MRVGTTVVLYTVLRDTVIFASLNTASPLVFRDRSNNVIQCFHKFFRTIDSACTSACNDTVADRTLLCKRATMLTSA
ncbi:hypothetical protein Y032_0576g204 [Ancylostoma ceylanicum]|uniref:Uncharacterized protein n=1 Tax=Ancylostoma ceylanicum TaxID=53326 RepID=A0A016WPL4_9BILA|nr:hypothetical protein Y032_0576g204 [Ancylostoma ceylanicum]